MKRFEIEETINNFQIKQKNNNGMNRKMMSEQTFHKTMTTMTMRRMLTRHATMMIHTLISSAGRVMNSDSRILTDIYKNINIYQLM